MRTTWSTLPAVKRVGQNVVIGNVAAIPNTYIIRPESARDRCLLSRSHRYNDYLVTSGEKHLLEARDEAFPLQLLSRSRSMSLHESGRGFKIELRQARTFQMQGTLWRVLATGEETGGLVGALDERSAHGIAAPMHVHEDADEIFYVLEGELTFFAGDQRIKAAPGALVYLPRFVHHGFQVDSEEARIFNFVTPAGFERLILDSGKPAHYEDAPIPVDPDTHHGQSPPQMLELFRKKYGMRAIPDDSK